MKKKFLLTSLAITLFLHMVNAQQISFDITGGYNVPLARQIEAKTEYVQSISTAPYFYSTSAKLRAVSYGQGGNVAVNLNWFSKKNIGFGLKLNAHIASPFNHTATIAGVGFQEYYTIKDQAFSIQFIPHLCFRYDFKRVSPILEMGMILGTAFIDHNYTITASNQTETIQTRIRDNGNVVVGFYSSLGLSFNVSKVVKIKLALTCNAASYSPARWKRKTFTVDGVDRLGNLAPGNIEGEYVADWTFGGKRAKTSVAFSGVGLNTGICFLFDGKKKKTGAKKPDAIQF
jgi:hypothetical protein